MPRPTAAQLAYGSATVVCSTLAMLLLSGTSTGIGVAGIGLAALALGLLVAMTVPAPGRTKAARAARTSRTSTGTSSGTPAGTAAVTEETRVPAARAGAGAEARVRQHSLRR
jgi:hypothetical protein